MASTPPAQRIAAWVVRLVNTTPTIPMISTIAIVAVVESTAVKIERRATLALSDRPLIPAQATNAGNAGLVFLRFRAYMAAIHVLTGSTHSDKQIANVLDAGQVLRRLTESLAA